MSPENLVGMLGVKKENNIAFRFFLKIVGIMDGTLRYTTSQTTYDKTNYREKRHKEKSLKKREKTTQESEK